MPIDMACRKQAGARAICVHSYMIPKALQARGWGHKSDKLMPAEDGLQPYNSWAVAPSLFTHMPGQSIGEDSQPNVGRRRYNLPSLRRNVFKNKASDRKRG